MPRAHARGAAALDAVAVTLAAASRPAARDAAGPTASPMARPLSSAAGAPRANDFRASRRELRFIASLVPAESDEILPSRAGILRHHRVRRIRPTILRLIRQVQALDREHEVVREF